MAALEFGLPSSLLLAGGLSDIATEPLSEAAIGDAFVPTGLLLEEPTILQGTNERESSRDQGGEFGGTCFNHSLDGGCAARYTMADSFSALASRKNRSHANCFILLPCPVSPQVQS